MILGTGMQLSRPAQEFVHRWTTSALLVIFVAIESVFNNLLFCKGQCWPGG